MAGGLTDLSSGEPPAPERCSFELTGRRLKREYVLGHRSRERTIRREGEGGDAAARDDLFVVRGKDRYVVGGHGRVRMLGEQHVWIQCDSASETKAEPVERSERCDRTREIRGAQPHFTCELSHLRTDRVGDGIQ